MTIAEWRAVVEGYAAKTLARRREQAWTVSHLLIAAGCDAEKVTPAKLLGEEEKRRSIVDEEKRRARERQKVLDKIRKDREKRGVSDF
jgi:hypothetical protein